MTDNELLASAFRKILNPGRYSYVCVTLDPPEITLDDDWGEADGLTLAEAEAMIRAVGRQGPPL